MILIADAGGSVTSWRYISSTNEISQLETDGFNMAHQNLDQYLEGIEDQLSRFENVRTVYLYVAGFDPMMIPVVDAAFKKVFPGADAFAFSDMLGAARSLWRGESFWAGILGTGANVSLFDGQEIKTVVKPLGYLLGDEGSGAAIGRKFLAAYLRDQLSTDLMTRFEISQSASPEMVIQQTYQGANTKKYWASVLPFIKENLKDEFCYNLVQRSFKEHFEAFFPDKKPIRQVCYTGSVAFHFSDVLRQVAADMDISIGMVTESPIAGLALYHQQNS